MSTPLSHKNRAFFDSGHETESYLRRSTHLARLDEMKSAFSSAVSHLRELHPNTPISVLDIGCSTGISTVHICSGHDGLSLYGLDVSESSLKEAALKGLSIQVGDIADGLPFRDSFVDIVIAGEIIEHIIEVDQFLREIHRCLTADGILLLSTPNLARLIDRIRFLVGLCPKQCIPDHRYLKYHVTPFTYSSLRYTLSKCGFEIKSLKSNYVYLDPTLLTNVKSRILAKLFPSLGNSLIVMCRRLP